jgi:two-component system OmpR family response regulator
MARLLVVEDDELLRDALAAQLRYASHAVQMASDAPAAMTLLQAGGIDAIVLDLGLPGMDGLALLDWIRQHLEALPVLVLTARDGVEDRVEGLQRGADDYLTKPCDMSEFLARVGSLLRRTRLNSGSQAGLGLSAADPTALRVDTAMPRGWIGAQPIELTQREWELLGLLLAQAGKVVGREEVLAVWQSGGAEPVHSNALEVYVHRLRRKLDASGWSIRNVRGLGYLLERERPAVS